MTELEDFWWSQKSKLKLVMSDNSTFSREAQERAITPDYSYC